MTQFLIRIQLRIQLKWLMRYFYHTSITFTIKYYLHARTYSNLVYRFCVILILSPKSNQYCYCFLSEQFWSLKLYFQFSELRRDSFHVVPRRICIQVSSWCAINLVVRIYFKPKPTRRPRTWPLTLCRPRVQYWKSSNKMAVVSGCQNQWKRKCSAELNNKNCFSLELNQNSLNTFGSKWIRYFNEIELIARMLKWDIIKVHIAHLLPRERSD